VKIHFRRLKCLELAILDILDYAIENVIGVPPFRKKFVAIAQVAHIRRYATFLLSISSACPNLHIGVY
jgi:hypothetical protein